MNCELNALVCVCTQYCSVLLLHTVALPVNRGNEAIRQAQIIQSQIDQYKLGKQHSTTTTVNNQPTNTTKLDDGLFFSTSLPDLSIPFSPLMFSETRV